MTQALTIEPRAPVLEIGTGSGYQTAVLSRLARLVYTVERYRHLLMEAEARFKQLDLLNVITKFGDGGEGWPEQAPFDRILVTAAAPSEPKTLLSPAQAHGRPGRADRQGSGSDPAPLRRRRGGRVPPRSACRGSLRSAARGRGAGRLTPGAAMSPILGQFSGRSVAVRHVSAPMSRLVRVRPREDARRSGRRASPVMERR